MRLKAKLSINLQLFLLLYFIVPWLLQQQKEEQTHDDDHCQKFIFTSQLHKVLFRFSCHTKSRQNVKTHRGTNCVLRLVKKKCEKSRAYICYLLLLGLALSDALQPLNAIFKLPNKVTEFMCESRMRRAR